MLWRFCLYGFLKNQRYFENFIVLAFLARGYSFFMIGLLLGFREICSNLMEIPSGAAADVLGRRRCMILSSAMYVAAFVLLGLMRALPAVFAAMFIFSIGEAFRTGTHKAMIFRWLKLHGRQKEKTRIYGLTRSWSKLGSALSSIIATAMLVLLKDYDVVFWLSAVPAALNIVNFLGYPAQLDTTEATGEAARDASVGEVLRAFRKALAMSFTHRPLRRLLAESMCFEGLFNSTKGYLQPIVQAAAVGLPLMAWLGDANRTYIMVGAIYFLLHVASSFASRHAETWLRLFRNAHRACGALWWVYLGVFASVLAYSLFQSPALAIAGFIVMATVQNFWRPILISRIADRADESLMATVLSVESQVKNIFSAALLPLVGLAVDSMGERWKFLPPAVLGLLVVAAVLALRSVKPRRHSR